MFKSNKPAKTSTPNERLRGRRSYKDPDDTNMSPIPGVPSPKSKENTTSPVRQRKIKRDENEDFIDESVSQEIESDFSSDEDSNPDTDNVPAENRWKWVMILVAIVIAVGSAAVYLYQYDKIGDFDTSSFENQSQNLKDTLKVGIHDMINKKQPKTFLFAYQELDDIDVEKILSDIARAALFSIGHESRSSLAISASELNEYVEDYGKAITHLKKKLEENVVLIVYNLEEIHGQVAQALHTVCEEYTPLVEKALIFLTIKVETYEKNLNEIIESKLKDSWELRPDILYPLLARVKSNVLKLKI